MSHIINRGQGLCYKFPELIHGVDYLIEGRNDETGEETVTWMNSNMPKPSEDDMAAWSAEANAVSSRGNQYEKICEQLDKIWHDINNGTLDKTGEFYLSIKSVKDANPKPEA